MNPALKKKTKRQRKNKGKTSGGVRRYWALIIWPLALIGLLVIKISREETPVEAELEIIKRQYEEEIVNLQHEIAEI